MKVEEAESGKKDEEKEKGRREEKEMRHDNSPLPVA